MFFLIVLFLSSFSLYTFGLERVPYGFHGDEAERALEAVKLISGEKNLFAFGWYGLSNVSFLLQGLGILIFGENIFGARISSSLVGAVGIAVYYVLVKKLFRSKKVAAFSSISLVVSHWWIAFSRVGMDYIEAASYQILVFLLLLNFIRKPNKANSILFGALLGISLYIYFAARISLLLVIPFLLHWEFNRTCSWGKKIKLSLIMIFSFLLVITPYVINAFKPPDAVSSRTQDVFIYGSGYGKEWRNETYGEDSVVEVLFKQAKKSVGIGGVLRDTSGQYGYVGPAFDPVTIVLIFLGIIFVIKKKESNLEITIPILWIALVLLFGGFLTIQPPFTPRLVGIPPPIYMMVGFGAVKIAQLSSKKRIGYLFLLVVFSLMLTWNFNKYFAAHKEERFGDTNKYVAKDIVDIVNNDKETIDVVFLQNHTLHATYGPFRYLLKNRNILEVDINRLNSLQPPYYLVIIKNEDVTKVMEEIDLLGADVYKLEPYGSIYKIY